MFKLKFILVTPWIELLKPSVVINLTHLFITVHQSRFWVATGIGSEEPDRGKFLEDAIRLIESLGGLENGLWRPGGRNRLEGPSTR